MRALVVMGGPMNVYQEKEHPFLKKENAFIRKAVKAGVPYFGVCLGSQLLAKALGARVYKARRPEVGWDDVSLTPAARKDPVFGEVGKKKLRVMQWHEDTFDIPSGAVKLASSRAVPNQAYVLDGRFYGLQFHVEADRPLLADWFKKHADRKEILAEHRRYRRRLDALTRRMYARFFALSAG